MVLLVDNLKMAIRFYGLFNVMHFIEPRVGPVNARANIHFILYYHHIDRVRRCNRGRMIVEQAIFMARFRQFHSDFHS